MWLSTIIFIAVLVILFNIGWKVREAKKKAAKGRRFIEWYDGDLL